MDNFLLYGLLLLACVNMRVAVTVRFYTSSRVRTSQVNQGDSVELWCSWGNIDVNKRVTWFRETSSSGMKTIWSYEGGRLTSQTVSNVAASGYEDKLIKVKQNTYRTQHKIKLLNAQKEDEGKYWCVVDINGVTTTSPSPKLTVNVPATTSSTKTTIITITTTATPIVTIANNSDTITESSPLLKSVAPTYSLSSSPRTTTPITTTATPIVTTVNNSDTITESSPLPQFTTPTYSLSSSPRATTPITTMPARDPTANEMYEAPDGNGGLPIPLIGGAAGGLVLVLIVVVVVIVVLRRKMKLNKDEETEMKENEYAYVAFESTVQTGSSGSSDHPKGTDDGKHKRTNEKATLEDETELKDHNYSEISPVAQLQTTDKSPKTSADKTPADGETETNENHVADISPVMTLQEEGDEKNKVSNGKVPMEDEEMKSHHYSESDPESKLQIDKNDTSESPKAAEPQTEEPYSYITHKQTQSSESDVQYYNVVNAGHSKVQEVSNLETGKKDKDTKQMLSNPVALTKPQKRPDKDKIAKVKPKPKASKEDVKQNVDDAQDVQLAEADIQGKKAVKQRKGKEKENQGSEEQCVKDNTNEKKDAKVAETENDPEAPVDMTKKKAAKETAREPEQKDAEGHLRMQTAQQDGKNADDVATPRHKQIKTAKQRAEKLADKKTGPAKEVSRDKTVIDEKKAEKQADEKTHAAKEASQGKSDITEKKTGKSTAKDSTNMVLDGKGEATDKAMKPKVQKKPKKVSKDKPNMKDINQAQKDHKTLDYAQVEKTQNGKQTAAASVDKISPYANVDKVEYGKQNVASDDSSTYAKIVTNNKPNGAENIVCTVPDTVYSAVEFRDRQQSDSDSD